jgi:hypothetical protein
MPSNDLALQAESLPTETPFEALPPQEEQLVEVEEVEVVETEGATEEIPTTPTTAEGRHPANHGKLSGKEPTVFTGDRKDAEAFILEWQIYQMLNYDAEIMHPAVHQSHALPVLHQRTSRT